MTSLVADERMSALLSQAQGLAEIRDSSGKVIGFFAPISLEHAPDYANAAAHLDRADIKRAKEEKGPSRTTTEVLEHLKSLDKT